MSDRLNYEQGDIVIVINRRNGHKFKLNEEIKIKELWDDPDVEVPHYLAQSVLTDDAWYVEEDEIAIACVGNNL